MADGKPGDGKTSPFGNGDGATSAKGPSNGAHDFTKDPGPSNMAGGHDFIKDPGPSDMASKARDFTTMSRAQSTGDMGRDPATIPAGGPMPFSGPIQAGKAPFKVGTPASKIPPNAPDPSSKRFK